MALSNFTKANAEAEARSAVGAFIGACAQVEEIQRRLAAEDAAPAHILDSPAFYADQPDDKTHLLAAVNAAMEAVRFYRGLLSAAEDGTINRRAYADFLLP